MYKISGEIAASSRGGITGTMLTLLQKQVKNQTKHMKQWLLRHWTSDSKEQRSLNERKQIGETHDYPTLLF